MRPSPRRAPIHVLLFILAALAAFRVAAQTQDTASTTASPAQAFAVPVPPGQIDKAIASLDELSQKTLSGTGIPGLAISVVKDGATVYAKGFGVRAAGGSAPVDADTVFQLASVSKSVGATVVAAMVGKKVVSWDSPVVKYLPSFALSDPWVTQHVTIGDLYAHRSGLPDHAGDDLEVFGYNRQQILQRLRFLPLAPFRSAYAYTNFGLTAAAEAVAAAAGQDWSELSQQAIYEPLGMASTSSRNADFKRSANRANGHVKTPGGFKPLYTRQPDPQSPAGGVSSSANDMAKWMIMVLGSGSYHGKQIVSPQALLPALTPQTLISQPDSADARASFYGYGFINNIQASGRVSLNHSGAFTTGAATTYLMIPSLRLGIVVLSNATPIGAVEALAMQFADLAQYGRITQDWSAIYSRMLAGVLEPFGELVGQKPPARAQPALKPEAYAGTYGNEYYGLAHIALRQGALTLTIGPNKTSYVLSHWDGNRYVFPVEPPNGIEGARSSLDFEVDENGRVQAMRVELLDDDGMGRFVRR